MATQAEVELKVGSEFWARQVIGYHGPGGDPQSFTITGETKTLWKARRTDSPEMKPFNINKDGSDWKPLPAEDAQKILWLRSNANRIDTELHNLTRNAYQGDVDLSIYDTLKAVDELLAERRGAGKRG